MGTKNIPYPRPLNSGLFGSRERERVDASPHQRPLNSGLFGGRERQRVDASPQQRPLNSELFGSRERQRVDASPLAGARGYLQITVRNYRAIAITTRWRSRLPANHSPKLSGDCYHHSLALAATRPITVRSLDDLNYLSV